MKKILLKAILAGLLIGIAGTIYLKIDNKIIGSLFFSFGLLVICCRNYYLYTGKVAYLITKKYNLKEILLIILGNLIGTLLVSLIIRYTNNDLVLKVNNMLDKKLSHNYLELLLLGLFCGILMYLAVDTYNNSKSDLSKIFILTLAVSIFILCGFEHSIADMFYIFLSGKISFIIVLKLFTILIGNALGAISLCFIENKISLG